MLGRPKKKLASRPLDANVSRETLQKLYQYSYSLCRNSADAYDLLQSALEKWLQSSTTSIANERAYIRTIIRNQFIDQCRRQNKVAFEAFDEDTPMALVSNGLEDTVIAADLVDKFMRHLSTTERETLYMSAVLGLTADNIAEELQQTRGTVLSRLHRIRKKAQSIEPLVDSSREPKVDDNHVASQHKSQHNEPRP